jgi:16S rRNA (guanine527-N7)-methyltransferase
MTEALLETDVRGELERGTLRLGLQLPPHALDQLVRFERLLEKWNSVYNLTAIRDSARIVSHHLLDSLALAPILGGGTLLDVGSGGGFPGVPLALAKPALSVTLLDSNQKKTAFLRQAVADLQLDNASVVCSRVEAWRSECLFDWIVSRAYSTLSAFAEGAEHLLAPGGLMVAMKGVKPEAEIASLPERFKVRDIIALEVPGLGAERHVVLMERA